MKIIKKKEKLIIEDDFFIKTYDGKKIKAFIGYIKNDGTCGLSYVIDMSYANKENQFSDILYYFDGTTEDFIKICNKLKIGIINEMSVLRKNMIRTTC